MVDYAAAIYSAKVNEVTSRLSGRLSEISARTGISFGDVFQSQITQTGSSDEAAMKAELIAQAAMSGVTGSDSGLGSSLLTALTGSGNSSGATDSLVDYLTAGGSIKNADSLLGVLSGNSSSTDALTQIVDALTKNQNSGTSSTALSGDKYTKYDAVIESIGSEYGLHPELIKAVIKAESDFNADCKSSAGAMGLMQLMPDTAEGLGVVDAFNPTENIDGGVRYLLGQIVRYDGDVKMALAAYNCGAGTLNKREISDLNDPDQFERLPSETKTYLNNIQKYLEGSGNLSLLNDNFFK